MEVRGDLNALGALPSGNNPGTHWLVNLVGPRTGLDIL